MNKKIKCDIYTRVSTTMQVDGYSLDAQKEKLKRYAEFQNMEIVNEYSDEGKSGKSVEGRPEFQRMLDNIENGTDEVQFVLVFKLSRFGRNAADVLNSLQRMQDFGVNLICVEDGIDSSKDSGKLMISVLSAVAEIERENILVQTMEGRKQKAREGKWNGGFAPYGYELVNGELQIAEDEAEIIRLIYDKFIHTNMGISAIAAWLNQHGYKKKKRQNNTLDAFAASFIKGVLDNQSRSVLIGERIFNETELACRLEVELEKYTMKVQIESRVLGDLAINHIVPTAVIYQNRLLENLRGLRETFSPEEYEVLSADRKELVREISKRVTAIKVQVREMTEARKVANHMDNYKDKAFAYEETVRPYLESIRDHIDHLEMEIDDEIWPLPKYRELLFTK